MRHFAPVPALSAIFVLAAGAQAPSQGSRPSWAFLTPDKDQPKVEERSAGVKVPGSSKEYTEKQIDDLANPPDWFPEEHGALPKVVQGGPGSTALPGVFVRPLSRRFPPFGQLALTVPNRQPLSFLATARKPRQRHPANASRAPRAATIATSAADSRTSTLVREIAWVFGSASNLSVRTNRIVATMSRTTPTTIRARPW